MRNLDERAQAKAVIVLAILGILLSILSENVGFLPMVVVCLIFILWSVVILLTKKK